MQKDEDLSYEQVLARVDRLARGGGDGEGGSPGGDEEDEEWEESEYASEEDDYAFGAPEKKKRTDPYDKGVLELI